MPIHKYSLCHGNKFNQHVTSADSKCNSQYPEGKYLLKVKTKIGYSKHNCRGFISVLVVKTKCYTAEVQNCPPLLIQNCLVSTERSTHSINDRGLTKISLSHTHAHTRTKKPLSLCFWGGGLQL